MKNNIQIVVKCINTNNESGFLLVLNEAEIEHYDIHRSSTKRRDIIDAQNIEQLLEFIYKNAIKIVTTSNDKATT
tara:strand:- start:212 stop:436 length:225 start_codon:yes stop_codon:yes gene_type:complete